MPLVVEVRQVRRATAVSRAARLVGVVLLLLIHSPDCSTSSARKTSTPGQVLVPVPLLERLELSVPECRPLVT